MDLILDQQSKRPVITGKPIGSKSSYFFNSDVIDSIIIDPSTEEALNELNKRVKDQSAGGGTDMYRAMTEALITLETYDLNKYNPAIILLTDGESGGSFGRLQSCLRRTRSRYASVLDYVRVQILNNWKKWQNTRAQEYLTAEKNLAGAA